LVQIVRGRLDEDRDGSGEQQPRQQQQGVGEQSAQIDRYVVEDVDAAAWKQIIGMIADVLNGIRLVLGEAALERKPAL
jgi:hypothetical protein